MADKYKVSIKSGCKIYRTPDTKGIVHSNASKGMHFTNCTKQVKKKRNKKTKKITTTVWYKVGNQMYVLGKYCKATMTYDDPKNNGGRGGGKSSKTPTKKPGTKIKNRKE